MSCLNKWPEKRFMKNRNPNLPIEWVKEIFSLLTYSKDFKGTIVKKIFEPSLLHLQMKSHDSLEEKIKVSLD